MTKLNQVIAVEKGLKARAYSELSDLHKAIQKPELFNGLSRTYQPKDEDGETLPPERKRVQFSVTDVLHSVERAIGGLMDLTASKDWTNCVATGDVTVDGKVLISGAPVSFLLFLEKQLTDMRTLADNLPVLDDAENWTFDPNAGLYRGDTTQTHRNRKVSKVVVLYPATEQHPAQTQLVPEDVLAGFWSQVKHSGAMPKPAKQDLVQRVEKLLHAVKEAREAANMTDVRDMPSTGSIVFGYLFKTETDSRQSAS